VILAPLGALLRRGLFLGRESSDLAWARLRGAFFADIRLSFLVAITSGRPERVPPIGRECCDQRPHDDPDQLGWRRSVQANTARTARQVPGIPVLARRRRAGSRSAREIASACIASGLAFEPAGAASVASCANVSPQKTVEADVTTHNSKRSRVLRCAGACEVGSYPSCHLRPVRDHSALTCADFGSFFLSMKITGTINRHTTAITHATSMYDCTVA
jgi:hypothetical protein